MILLLYFKSKNLNSFEFQRVINEIDVIIIIEASIVSTANVIITIIE